MRLDWTRHLAAAGLALATVTATAPAQQDAPPAPAAPAQGGSAPARSGDKEVSVGPIDGPRDLVETAKVAFKLADTNNDNQISQKEATDVGNLIVGGFFFRADQNGDGTLTADEARQARDSLFAQQPWVRFVIRRVARDSDGQGGGQQGQQGEAGVQVARQVGSLIDANSDKQIQASELRQAVETVVQGMFAAGDSNRDGQLTPDEFVTMGAAAAKQAATAAFQAADADNNGSLSKEEFLGSLREPAATVFDILDRNLDGQLSTEELQQAARVVGQQLRNLDVPTPAALNQGG